MKIFFGMFADIFYFLKGKYLSRKSANYSFAFLVHSRGINDVYRKFPLLRKIPKSIVSFIANNLWPITLSKVSGVISEKDGSEVPGYVFGITMTAEAMMRDRKRALVQIRRALYLARGRNALIIGLGGLTSSLSGGGKELLDIDIHITTGHAYTAYNVTQNLFKVAEMFGMPKSVPVAIVGAAGSVGSISALILARAGYGSITLIDLNRKKHSLKNLQEEMERLNPKIHVSISTSILDISPCDFVITATNTPDALIKPIHVRDGMVIIDDAQPSDIHPDVLKMENVLVIEGGVVDTPGIRSNFNYGLKKATDNFCCMAEVLILASNNWKGHYVIHRATLENVDSITKLGYNLGFKVAAFQNFLESITEDKLNRVKNIVRRKYGLQS